MRNPVKIVSKLWGREHIIHDGEYCAKILEYDGPRVSSKHYHENKHETFVVLRGEFEIAWGEKGRPLKRRFFGPGEVLVLPPYTVHRVECVTLEGGRLFEASSKEDPADCVRLEPSVNPFGK